MGNRILQKTEIGLYIKELQAYLMCPYRNGACQTYCAFFGTEIDEDFENALCFSSGTKVVIGEFENE